jgi:hypothetical protein
VQVHPCKSLTQNVEDPLGIEDVLERQHGSNRSGWLIEPLHIRVGNWQLECAGPALPLPIVHFQRHHMFARFRTVRPATHFSSIYPVIVPSQIRRVK